MSRKTTILIVDDEPNIRWTMAEFLKREGYDTVMAPDFDSAVLIGNASIDAAVVDIFLPGKSGIELLKELRNREPYIPIIMITGEPNPAQIPEMVRAGAYDFLSKPVIKEVLIKAVARAIEKKHLIDEKRRLEHEIKQHVEHLEVRVAERTRELMESEEKFRAQYKGIPVPTYTWRKAGEDFVLTDYNNAAEAFTCGRVADLIGKAASDVYRERPDILEDFSRCFNEKTAFKREILYTFRSTGETKYLNVNYVFVPPDLVMAHLEDITERKRAEEALRDSEQRYRLLFDSNPLPTWVYDLETLSFLAVNEAAINHYGYSQEEFLAMTVKDIRPPEDIPILLADLAKVATGINYNGIWRHIKKDGTIIKVEVTAHSLIFDGKRAQLVLANDITEQIRTEDALRQMQARLAHSEKIAALGRVAAQVAHEVKNPLAGLRLYALHLKQKVAGELADNEMVLIDKIVSTIDHLTSTVEQILNFARPINMMFRPLHLNQVVTDVVQLLRPQVAANKVEVKLALSESELTGMLDEASTRSALINVMLNAIQAMPGGGELTVTTGRAGGLLHLTISDTGCGMSKEQLNNIFEPFYTTKSQGLGLGMAYVRKIIEQNKGTILVESNQGEGTSIQISLPEASEIERAAVPYAS